MTYWRSDCCACGGCQDHGPRSWLLTISGLTNKTDGEGNPIVWTPGSVWCDEADKLNGYYILPFRQQYSSTDSLVCRWAYFFPEVVHGGIRSWIMEYLMRRPSGFEYAPSCYCNLFSTNTTWTYLQWTVFHEQEGTDYFRDEQTKANCVQAVETLPEGEYGTGTWWSNAPYGSVCDTHAGTPAAAIAQAVPIVGGFPCDPPAGSTDDYIDCEFTQNDAGLWQCGLCDYTCPVPLDTPPHRNCPSISESTALRAASVAGTLCEFTKNDAGLWQCKNCNWTYRQPSATAPVRPCPARPQSPRRRSGCNCRKKSNPR